MWRMGIPNSYTMESTFGGSTLGKGSAGQKCPIARGNWEDGRLDSIWNEAAYYPPVDLLSLPTFPRLRLRESSAEVAPSVVWQCRTFGVVSPVWPA